MGYLQGCYTTSSSYTVAFKHYSSGKMYNYTGGMYNAAQQALGLCIQDNPTTKNQCLKYSTTAAEELLTVWEAEREAYELHRR